MGHSLSFIMPRFYVSLVFSSLHLPTAIRPLPFVVPSAISLAPLCPLLSPSAPLIQGYWVKFFWSPQSVMWPLSWLRPDIHYEDWQATAAHTHLAGWQSCPLLPLSNDPLLSQKNAGATLIRELPRCPDRLGQNLDRSGEILKLKAHLRHTWGNETDSSAVCTLFYERWRDVRDT